MTKASPVRIRIADRTEDVPEPPRPAPLWPSMLKFGGRLVVGADFALIAVVLTIVFSWLNGFVPPGPDFFLLFGSRTVAGTVTAVERIPNAHENGRGLYRVEFAFDADGKAYRGVSVTSDPAALACLTAGASCTVEYMATAPTQCQVAGLRAGIFPWWAFGLLFVMFAVASILLVSGILCVQKDRAVLREGRVTTGTVTRAKMLWWMNMPGGHPVDVRYDYEDPMGEVLRGKCSVAGGSAVEAPEVGGQVVVLYDEMDPRISALWVIREEAKDGRA